MPIEIPSLTESYRDAASFTPAQDAVYVYGCSGEERSTHVDLWMHKRVDVRSLKISKEDDYEIQIEEGSEVSTIPLRSGAAIQTLVDESRGRIWYLDITGISHHAWAPLLKGLLHSANDIRVVYVEPSAYQQSRAPTEGQFYDLSSRIRGIAPLPGFAALRDVSREQFVLVPLIGFEGARFAYVVEDVQPGGGKIYPVVGVPGFQLGFPFNAYLGNRRTLEETGSWQNVRYAPAYCPFSLFNVIDDLNAAFPTHRLKIAPIGTKPHALGAVLFAISHPNRTEIVYDHPIRKDKRTTGMERLYVYHVTAFGAD